MTQPLLLAVPDSDIAPVTEDAVVGFNLSDTTKGTITEKLFEVEALRRGWYVASNSGGGSDFDTIVKRPCMSVCVVIQTRRATFKDGRYQINLGTKGQTQPYSNTAFDVLAVHLPDNDDLVFFTRAEMGNRTGTSYVRPKDRKRAAHRGSMPDRDANNWNLLDEVAAAKINSGPRTADVPDPQ